MSTESTLREWRFGQTQAERLAAGVLTIEGFAAVDPQHPLGGPDGLKDVLCRRGLTSFVAAVYFPSTEVDFSKVKKKFQDDLVGVAKNGARGFVFFVNQKLTIGERDELLKLATGKADLVEIYHLERLRAVLDSPLGCGLRLEYLRIAMTHEEQLAYWSSANIDMASKLDRIETLQVRTLDQITTGNEDLVRRTAAIQYDLRAARSSALGPPPALAHIWQSGPATSSIDVPLLLWIHRLVMTGAGLPEALVGHLRTLSVTVEAGNADPLSYAPPQPEELRSLLTNWCESWRNGYPELLNSEATVQIELIATAYHRLLKIHPFLDGNGRVARVVLDQMLREIFSTSLPPSFIEARAQHQSALQAADAGDIEPLRDLLASSLA